MITSSTSQSANKLFSNPKKGTLFRLTNLRYGRSFSKENQEIIPALLEIKPINILQFDHEIRKI